VDDPIVAELYADRTWVSPSDLDIDPIEWGANAEIPINSARAKFIRSDDLGGLNSLAAKLYLIEHAEHTLDLVYYICPIGADFIQSVAVPVNYEIADIRIVAATRNCYTDESLGLGSS
jgi:hypothetical protein